MPEWRLSQLLLDIEEGLLPKTCTKPPLLKFNLNASSLERNENKGCQKNFLWKYLMWYVISLLGLRKLKCKLHHINEFFSCLLQGRALWTDMRCTNLSQTRPPHNFDTIARPLEPKFQSKHPLYWWLSYYQRPWKPKFTPSCPQKGTSRALIPDLNGDVVYVFIWGSN